LYNAGWLELRDDDGTERDGKGAPVAALPRQAVEATKRVLNLHAERAVETASFDTPHLRANVDRFLGGAASTS
jgi:hypothetical protein